MVLKSREKILIVLAIIVIAILAFDRFYYTPQSRKIQKLKAEVKAADLKLNEFLLVAKGVETLETEVLRQEGELKRLSERTLKGEEFRTFLKHLAKESDPLQMKVISLIPQEEKLPLPEGKKETSASQYRKVSVQMVLHSTYTKLGGYLKGVEELPFLIHVDNLQVEKNEEVHPLLKVTLGLNMYMTEESKGVKGSRGLGIQ
jgi:Tfp pilus assembly protein PilO